MKAIICVVARESSTRLPGKALLELGGQMIISQIIRRVRFGGFPVVVCTDTESPGIVSAARNTAHGCVTGDAEDVASRLLQAASEGEADTIVRVTGDNPFTCPNLLASLVEIHRATGAEYTHAPYLPAGTKSEVIDVAKLAAVYSTMTKPQRNHTEYLTTTLRGAEWGFRTTTVHTDDYSHMRFTVDHEVDLKRAREVYAAFDSGWPLRPTIPDLCNWWVRRRI